MICIVNPLISPVDPLTFIVIFGVLQELQEPQPPHLAGLHTGFVWQVFPVAPVGPHDFGGQGFGGQGFGGQGGGGGGVPGIPLRILSSNTSSNLPSGGGP